MTVITITTDFGTQDNFVGVLKGVIWNICPGAQIADLTHAIPPQNVAAGALSLAKAVPFFPAGSVHIAVVDPGVGTTRRPMAARLGSQYVVGPDNGLFTLLIDAAGDDVEFVALDNPKYFLAGVSNTFHGRDIFSPVAAHLANGVPLAELGTKFTDPVRLELSQPEKTSTGWAAHIASIDVFGNMATDLRAELLEGRRDVLIRILGREIDGLVDSYGWRKPGDLVSLIDSEGYLEVAVVNGSAGNTLGAKVGDLVEIIYR